MLPAESVVLGCLKTQPVQSITSTECVSNVLLKIIEWFKVVKAEYLENLINSHTKWAIKLLKLDLAEH